MALAKHVVGRHIFIPEYQKHLKYFFHTNYMPPLYEILLN